MSDKCRDLKTAEDKAQYFNAQGNIGKPCQWNGYPDNFEEFGVIVGPAFVMRGQNLEMAVVPVENSFKRTIAVSLDGVWY